MSRMAPTTARSKGYILAALSTGRNHWLQPISLDLKEGGWLNAVPQFRLSNSDTQLVQSQPAASAPLVLSDQEIAKPNPASTDKRSATR